MHRLTIRRFDIVRTANIVAVIYLLIALVFGLFIFLPFALIGGIASSQAGSGAGVALGAGLVGGLIFYVIIVAFYAIAGWIFGAIVAALYNIVAGRIGGLQLDVSREGPSSGAPGCRSAPTRRGLSSTRLQRVPAGLRTRAGPDLARWRAHGFDRRAAGAACERPAV